MARIVQIVADGRPGGGTTAALGLSRLLAERGNDVSVFTQKDSYLLEQAAIFGLQPIGLDFSRRRRAISTGRYIGEQLKRLAPATVHAHGPRAALPAALIARGAWQFVYTVHGFQFRLKPPVASHMARSVEAFCIARADYTVFVSDADLSLAMRSRLLPKSGKFRVIKNAIDMNCGALPGAKRYDIGFVGRLHPQKNPLILVDIITAMRPLRPSLCIVGGGELEGSLRSRIDREGLIDQVTFYGERGRAEALQIASSCRTLVLPSLSEGHPIVLIEAMHLGLPAVASNVVGSNEIIVDGETGYLVPAPDAAAYADRLVRLLADPALRDRMGDNARRRVKAPEYSPAQLLADHLAIYSQSAYWHRLADA